MTISVGERGVGKGTVLQPSTATVLTLLLLDPKRDKVGELDKVGDLCKDQNVGKRRHS